MSDTPPATYWLLTDGLPTGPFTADEIRGKVARGEVAAGVPTCPFGGSVWTPLSEVFGLAPAVAAVDQAASSRSDDATASSSDTLPRAGPEAGVDTGSPTATSSDYGDDADRLLDESKSRHVADVRYYAFLTCVLLAVPTGATRVFGTPKAGFEDFVTLKEVASRFADARKKRSAFPFLHDFSYRTVGWEWAFGRGEASTDLAGLVEGLLEHFLADAVESSPADLRVRLNLKAGKLQVLDAAPGGNGLSRAILADGRAAEAFGRCAKQLEAFGGRGGVTRFKKYVLNLCQVEPCTGVSEVRDAVCKLRERWAG